MRLADPIYRTRQFLHAVFPRLDAAHIEEARSILSEGEMRLFLAMEKPDQRHGLRVMHHLVGQGQRERDLLAAALLHDCAKGRVPVALRVMNVLAPWGVKMLARSAEDASSVGISGACYRLVHHARLGAEMTRAAGSSEATVRYVEGRTAEHERDKITMLRAADDRS